MDKKEVSISRKFMDDKIVTSKAKFIFTSNFNVSTNYNMFLRRIKYIYIEHKMYDCTGCQQPFIPDNQLGLFDLNGDQILIDLSTEMDPNFTLDISDENAHDPFDLDGLNNILTREEQQRLFDSF